MGKLSISAARLAAFLVLHAAGVGLALPTVLVEGPKSTSTDYWLPIDNQTVYTIGEKKMLRLELNTSSISQSTVFVTVSPCSADIHWSLLHGNVKSKDDHFKALKEYSGDGMQSFSVIVLENNRYFLQLSSVEGAAAAVSVRGEASRTVRMRLRVRSRRRLAANWDPSPVDPQATTYYVVASHIKNYTSLCAAQNEITRSEIVPSCFDLKSNHSEPERNRRNNTVSEFDNKIGADDSTFNVYNGYFKSAYPRKKFSRSTKVSGKDPVVACVGDRTHHLIENLDTKKTYFVSVFGVARDRQAGTLLATGSVRPRSSTTKRLWENVPYRADVKGKMVYYFKGTIGIRGGLWLAVSTCGGTVDIEISVRGKRLYTARNIDPHTKFFVPAPIPSSSVQETSDESSVQMDSSSEEARIRYVIKISPGRWEKDVVGIEVTASTARWGINTPELLEDGTVVRELRPRRSCKSVDIAFLPAVHYVTDAIRYCIEAHESVNGNSYTCKASKKSSARTQCINQAQKPPAKVIVQRINGLKAGRKYVIQVAAINNGSSVSYNPLYVDTNSSCKTE